MSGRDAKRKTISTSSSDSSFSEVSTSKSNDSKKSKDAKKDDKKELVKKPKLTQSTLPIVKMTMEAQLKVISDELKSSMSLLKHDVGIISNKLSTLVTNEQLKESLETMATKKDLTVAIESAKDDLIVIMNDRIEKLESRVLDLEIQNDKMCQKVAKLENKVAETDAEIKEIGFIAEKANYDINELEQYTRKSSIRVFGLEDDENEKMEETCKKVVTFLSEKVKMSIKDSDIDISHRLGKFRVKQNRPVIVKFMCRRKKLESIEKRTNLRNTKYVIKDDLTRGNQYLMSACQYDERISETKFQNGKILVRLTSNNSVIRVHPGFDFDQLN